MASDSSPAWVYPLGGTASPANGWVRCAFSGVTLPAGKYRVSVYNGAANPDAWSAKALYYFGSTNGYTGPGSPGLTFGPVYAPGLPAASDAYIYDPNGGSNNPPYSNGSGSREPGQATYHSPWGRRRPVPRPVRGRPGPELLGRHEVTPTTQ